MNNVEMGAELGYAARECADFRLGCHWIRLRKTQGIFQHCIKIESVVLMACCTYVI